VVVVRRALGTVRAVLRLRHVRGRLLVARDLQAFLRMECLGTLVRSGLAGALGTPGTAADLAARAGLTDVELTTALLDTGVAFRLVRRRGATYAGRGARLRTVASGRAPDAAGMSEEAVAYDAPIYAGLVDHLRGAPPRDYDAGLGDEIARVSRVVEPVVGPWLAAQAAGSKATRVLDVGCGSGVNLRWIAEALPHADRLQGIDLDADAIAGATANLVSWGLEDRVDVRVADLRALPDDLAGPWDVVVLAQNIYYWPVDERTDVLRRVRELTGGTGTALVLSGVPSRSAFGRHLDVALRVTSGCYRLPTIDELGQHAREAGFAQVRVRDLVPGVGMGALVARG
jgi:SAM-dependent methyltransferase